MYLEPTGERPLEYWNKLVDEYVLCRGLNPSVLKASVSQIPSDEERLSHRVITPPSQSMFLMADLRRMDG